MKNIFFYFVIALFIISCSSVQKYNQQISMLHPVKGLLKDVDMAYAKLQNLHPKLYLYIAKEQLDYKFDSLKTTIKNPMSSQDFYKKLAPVIAEVRQGHVSVSPPMQRFTKKEIKGNKKKKFEFYELDFEIFRDSLWIVNTRGLDSTIIGSTVVKINDEPVSSLIANYKKLFTSDGYNTTFHNKIIGARFSGYYYKDKGFLDSLSMTIKNKDSLYTKIFRRIAKDSLSVTKKVDSLKITPKKLTKTQRKLAKAKRKQKKKDNIKYGYVKPRKRYTRNFDFIGKDSSIAYLKIRGFTKGKFKEFYKESFTKIDSAKSKNLIIDLRDNTGGRLAEIDKLYSYLTDKDYQIINKSEVLTKQPMLKYLMSENSSFLGKVLIVLVSPGIVFHSLLKTSKEDGKKYFKFKSAKLKKPNPLNFKGNIYVLINGGSYSASSILSTNLQATKRAIFVGEETGGAYNGTVAGVFKFIELPTSKIKMRIGLAQIEALYKTEQDGYGIKPDVKIIPTIKDRLQNIDPELEWILNDVETKKSN
ncbi:MAG TPA: peptidase S41 [Flavobacteriaceae bacterium]|nr:peptidase S41 [Flavobacteriaceae bacterium]HBS11353.1 peptidase S41 [Flavobacteriaceae bacterium]